VPACSAPFCAHPGHVAKGNGPCRTVSRATGLPKATSPRLPACSGHPPSSCPLPAPLRHSPACLGDAWARQGRLWPPRIPASTRGGGWTPRVPFWASWALAVCSGAPWTPRGTPLCSPVCPLEGTPSPHCPLCDAPVPRFCLLVCPVPLSVPFGVLRDPRSAFWASPARASLALDAASGHGSAFQGAPGPCCVNCSALLGNGCAIPPAEHPEQCRSEHPKAPRSAFSAPPAPWHAFGCLCRPHSVLSAAPHLPWCAFHYAPGQSVCLLGRPWAQCIPGRRTPGGSQQSGAEGTVPLPRPAAHAAGEAARDAVAFWAASAHRRLVSSFSSPSTPKSFSAGLLSTPSSPAWICACDCTRPLHLAFFNFWQLVALLSFLLLYEACIF